MVIKKQNQQFSGICETQKTQRVAKKAEREGGRSERPEVKDMVGKGGGIEKVEEAKGLVS